jgi:hypothetical protein
MPLRPSTERAALPVWLCRLLTLGLILGAAFLHVAYLANHCPLDLSPDEAHYWDWSRHLDWSYYSKGPLVAYLIRGGCELFGPWSMHATGSLMLAVRLPAVLCGSLLLLGMYILTVQVYGRESLALALVALALTLPIISAGACLMTIDAPYTCCWAWALVLAHRAIFRGAGWAWPVCGAVVGLGILAKYTMIVFVPSVFLYLLTTPVHRRLLLRPGFWSMCAVGAVCCTPIIVWNVQHHWISFYHVKGLTGLQDDPKIYWFGPLTFLLGQAALLLLFWFIVWVGAMVIYNPLREADPDRRFLWWLSAPMFALFLLFGFKTGGGELNWPVTAYLSGMVLAAPWLGHRLSTTSGWNYRVALGGMLLACVCGVLMTALAHYSSLMHPLIECFTGTASPRDPLPMRHFDPTCRLRGWKALGKSIDHLRAELKTETGEDPVLACCCWAWPGEVGFYCNGHPQAYSLGEKLSDRCSQYDLWDGPVRQPERFLGRTFIVVNIMNNDLPRLREAFAPGGVGPSQVIWYKENDRPLAVWSLTVCRGYRGFPSAHGPSRTY